MKDKPSPPPHETLTLDEIYNQTRKTVESCLDATSTHLKDEDYWLASASGAIFAFQMIGSSIGNYNRVDELTEKLKKLKTERIEANKQTLNK